MTKDYFDQLCPHKVDLDRGNIHATLSDPNSAQEMTEKWSTTLKGMDEPCVQASQGSGPIYSHHEYAPSARTIRSRAHPHTASGESARRS